MSEYDDVNERRKEDAQATVRTAKWSPLVWIVPVLAIFFAGYLVVRYGFFGGGDITVRFTEARGLDRYSPVRFRGAKVGTVQKITVDEKLDQVVVRISMDATMRGALRKGTRFWIVEPGIESGGIGGLLSGTYVGIAPAEGEGGEEQSEFVGQEYAPILAAPEAGKTFILEGVGTGSIAIGAPVQLGGIKVGRVLGSEYDPKTGATSVHVFVVQRFADRVRQGSRFYRGGGLNLSLGGGGVSMNGASIASLLNAPISFYTPEVLAGAPAAEGTRFELYESESVASAAADGAQLTYVTYFPGSLHGLKPGTPVTMKGVPVGFVRDVRLRYIANTASLESPVVFTIDPRKLEMPVSDASSREELRAMMNDALAKMVRKGMRASLATSLVLPGASAIALERVASANSARLGVEHEPPIVPAADTGSGIEGALGAISGVANKISNLPIDEIASDIRSASRRINALVSDPALDRSLQKLDASMTDVQRAARLASDNIGPITSSLRNAAGSAESAASTVKENVAPIVESLRNAASSAESAAGRAQQLMGTSARQNYDLGELIKELTKAAESVRALADYINENPDALLKGRAKGSNK